MRSKCAIVTIGDKRSASSKLGSEILKRQFLARPSPWREDVIARFNRRIASRASIKTSSKLLPDYMQIASTEKGQENQSTSIPGTFVLSQPTRVLLFI